jgi:predicted GH43/DUF377 family glycosyl hydrolase
MAGLSSVAKAAGMSARRVRASLVSTAGVILLVVCGAVSSGGVTAETRASRSLPGWAIGPFHRYAGNPLLTPPVVPNDSNNWAWPERFNPSVVVVNGVFHMLYRGAASGNYSSIGAAHSRDGIHFTEAKNNPVIRRSLSSEKHGVEDPRLYYHDGTYYAFFTGYDGTNIGINEATSTDAVHWKQLGRKIPDTKNAAVVADPRGRPVKVGGKYLMYYGQSGNGTHIARSTDLVHWTTTGTVHTGFPKSYDPFEFCVAVTNYRTMTGSGVRPGIVLFVAGELMGHGRWYYAISEIHFVRSNLTKPDHRLDRPVLSPHAKYEIYGYTPRTVFMENIIFQGGKWLMYYGAGDSDIALATSRLRH